MEFKDLPGFYDALEKLDPETPGIAIVSGSDTAAFGGVVERLKKILAEKIGAFETSALSGEPGDDDRLFEDLLNIPLFASYRFFILSRGEDIFKRFVGSKKALATLAEDMSEKLPDRTMILMRYEGTIPKGLLSAFGAKTLHINTRDLYPNQIPEFIRRTALSIGILLDDEAAHELQERTAPRAGTIERTLKQLKERMPENKHKNLSVADVREALFPNPDYNPFELTDALFSGDFAAFQREMIRLRANSEHLFIVLKLMLSRLNQIRRAALGRSQSMNEEEVIELLDLRSKPPFIRRKILQRLHREVPRFDAAKIETIYELLIRLQLEFRGAVPQNWQASYFEERIRRIFFT